MTTAEPTALDILKAARAKIADPKDWGQGMRSERRGTFCAAEAIEEFTHAPTWKPWSERRRALRALYNAADVGYNTLCDWNDDPERTHAEVLAAFDLAIATLRLS